MARTETTTGLAPQHRAAKQQRPRARAVAAREPPSCLTPASAPPLYHMLQTILMIFFLQKEIHLASQCRDLELRLTSYFFMLLNSGPEKGSIIPRSSD